MRKNSSEMNCRKCKAPGVCVCLPHRTTPRGWQGRMERAAREAVDRAYDNAFVGRDNATKMMIRFAQRERTRALREAAKKVGNIYGGPVHTMLSENSERYRAQDETIKIAVESILALDKPPKRGRADDPRIKYKSGRTATAPAPVFSVRRRFPTTARERRASATTRNVGKKSPGKHFIHTGPGKSCKNCICLKEKTK